MEIDRDIEPSTPQSSRQPHIVCHTCNATRPRRHDYVVEMGVATHDRKGEPLDDVRQVSVGKLPA